MKIELFFRQFSNYSTRKKLGIEHILPFSNSFLLKRKFQKILTGKLDESLHREDGVVGMNDHVACTIILVREHRIRLDDLLVETEKKR